MNVCHGRRNAFTKKKVSSGPYGEIERLNSEVAVAKVRDTDVGAPEDILDELASIVESER